MCAIPECETPQIAPTYVIYPTQGPWELDWDSQVPASTFSCTNEAAINGARKVVLKYAAELYEGDTLAEIQTAVGKLDDRLDFLSPRSAGSVGAAHILRYMEEFGYVTQFSKDDYTAVIKGKLQH